MYDLLIRNAQLLDGSGQPAFRGDIAVEQGRIVAIGDLSAGRSESHYRRRGSPCLPRLY